MMRLTNSKVTDAGLEHLKRPKKEESVVTLTEVTDAGLEWMRVCELWGIGVNHKKHKWIF